MRDLRIFRTMGIGLVSGALVAAAALGASAETVTIGAVGPMTGPAANTGEAAKQGMSLAVKDWNEGRGEYATANPPQVKLVFEDSNSKPEVGISAAQRLITRDQVSLLMGDTLHSHVTMAMMELAPQYSKPILSVEPVSSAIAAKVAADPERYALYWKGNYNSDAYGAAVHDFYRWTFDKELVKPESRTIAFVVEDTDYGLSNAKSIAELFEADGWTIAATETAPVGSTDFYPQLSKLRQMKPDILVSVFTAVNSGIAFVRQFNEQQVGGSHLAIYYPTKPEFLEQVGDNAEGLFWATQQFSPEVVPAHQEFSDRIKAEYGATANYSHAHSYCVMKVALRALEAAGGTDPQAIAEAIGNTDTECLIGRFQFGDDHAVKAGENFIPLPVAQIQDGVSQIIWPESISTAQPK